MKKFVSLVLVLIMLISALSVLACAENSVKLSLTSETVYAGDEFTLKLFISDNSKMSGAVIDINYDKNMLGFVSAEQGAILDKNANISIKNIDGEKSKVRFTYLAPNSAVTSEGVVMSVTFKALDNATGNTDLTVTIPNAGDFVTQDLDRISYEVSNSVVKIINITYIEPDESEAASSTESTSQTIDTDIPSTEEQTNNNVDNDDDNGSNTIYYIVLLVIGLLCITGGVVILVCSKKKRRNNP